MAIIFADPGGAFYANTTQATQGLYASLVAAAIVTSGLPAGAKETTALLSTANLTGQITVPSSSGPYSHGFRVYIPTTIGSGQNICAFVDGTNNPQITFQTNANGTVTAKRGGGNGTVLGTSSGVNLVANTWNYIEFQVTCNSSTGTVAMQINNTNVLNLTGQNTQGAAGNLIAAIQFAGMNTAAYFQDIYVTSSSAPNPGFLGDVSMPVLNANRAGGFSQYTPNGAATIWQCVDDPTPDDLTTFASDSTVNDRMSVGYNSVAVSGAILGVMHLSRVSKSDAGARTFSQTLTSNSVDVITTAQSPGTTFAYYTQFAQIDPATGSAFTNAGINALQGGVKTIS